MDISPAGAEPHIPSFPIGMEPALHAHAARLVEWSRRWRNEIGARAGALGVNLGGTLKFALHDERLLLSAMERGAGDERIAELVDRLDSNWDSRGTAPFGLIRHGIYRPAEQHLHQAARDLAAAGIQGEPLDALRQAPERLRDLQLSGLPSGPNDLGRLRFAFDELMAGLQRAARAGMAEHPEHGPLLQRALVSAARALGQAMQGFEAIDRLKASMARERPSADPVSHGVVDPLDRAA